MSWFKKQKTAEQFGQEAVSLIQSYQQGTLSKDAYRRRVAEVSAGFMAALKTMRFTINDVDRFMSSTSHLDVRAKITLYGDFMNNYVAAGDPSPYLGSVIGILASEVFNCATTEAVRLNAQQQWSDGLFFCQMAEKAATFFDYPEPGLYIQLGYALWGLQRINEAHQAFMKGEAIARDNLSKSGLNLNSEQRDTYSHVIGICQAEAQKLAPYVRK